MAGVERARARGNLGARESGGITVDKRKGGGGGRGGHFGID